MPLPHGAWGSNMSPFHSLQAHPLGAPIPDSPHAVSCSLPRMRDVIAYEEKNPATLEALKAGYPRFVRHPWIATLLSEIERRYSLQGRALFAVRSGAVREWACEFLQSLDADLQAGSALDIEAFREKDFWVLHSSPALGDRIQKFLQHTGLSISSRQAEDALIERGILSSSHEEVPLRFLEGPPSIIESKAGGEGAEAQIQNALALKHGTPFSEDIYLGNSGMSCFYAAFRALQEMQAKEGRSIWIQLGWLYLDTIDLLKKCSPAQKDYVYFQDVFDLDELRSFIEKNSENIAGVVTEAPTNPLVETPDIEALRSLTRQHGIALILDPTIASPLNIHCLSYADVIVNSLTKYAASEGDIMMGSLALNRSSGFYEGLRSNLSRYLVAPYRRDIERMAAEIQNYDAVVSVMNANNQALVSFLESHPRISKIYHAYSKESRSNFEKIQKKAASPGCMISIEIDGNMEKFYDSISIAKGPSFGMRYSLLCPFIYLAHYDLIQSTEGRAVLQKNRLNPDLIRVSVGCEDPDEICGAFAMALKGL